jgi:RNA polymerase sigma-70 factor (ECF subfamily)
VTDSPPSARERLDEPWEDRQILVRVAAGDATALGHLYDRHGRTLYSVACRMLGNPSDAEDLVQDVFSQAWKTARAYDPSRAPVVGWLLMMCRTRAIDRLRARSSRVPITASQLPDYPDPAAGAEATVITAEEAARVRAALAGLGEQERAAIELAYYDGLTQSEIAERLQQPLGTIKTRIRAGLGRLRAALRTE